MHRLDLKNQRAVVTGGAQGIGRAIVERLLDSGVSVTIWDRDGPLALQTAGALAPRGSVCAIEADVTDPGSVTAAAEDTRAQLGGIDILVNNAGISGHNAVTWDYPVEAWHEILNIDLTGVFLCCRAVVPSLIAQNYGRVINMASIAGKEGNAEGAAYSAAKAGVIALTKALGKELAGHDISVNCVTPSIARTPIFAQMTQRHIDTMLAKVPRGRFVSVEEIAAMVAWLASRECSFTTGAVFDLSGGRATY